MVNMESEPKIDKVAERTGEFAARVGESAFWVRVYDLKRHVEQGRLDPDVLFEIASVEEQEAQEKYKAERDAGKHNDLMSEYPGLTALIKPQVKEQYISWIKPITGGTISFTDPTFEEVGSIDNPLLQMRLAEGVFSIEENGIAMNFFVEAVTYNGTVMRGKEGTKFRASKWDVVRIEGDAGELWQNPGYKPNGSYIEIE